MCSEEQKIPDFKKNLIVKIYKPEDEDEWIDGMIINKTQQIIIGRENNPFVNLGLKYEGDDDIQLISRKNILLILYFKIVFNLEEENVQMINVTQKKFKVIFYNNQDVERYNPFRDEKKFSLKEIKKNNGKIEFEIIDNYILSLQFEEVRCFLCQQNFEVTAMNLKMKKKILGFLCGLCDPIFDNKFLQQRIDSEISILKERHINLQKYYDEMKDKTLHYQFENFEKLMAEISKRLISMLSENYEKKVNFIHNNHISLNSFEKFHKNNELDQPNFLLFKKQCKIFEKSIKAVENKIDTIKSEITAPQNIYNEKLYKPFSDEIMELVIRFLNNPTSSSKFIKIEPEDQFNELQNFLKEGEKLNNIAEYHAYDDLEGDVTIPDKNFQKLNISEISIKSEPEMNLKVEKSKPEIDTIKKSNWNGEIGYTQKERNFKIHNDNNYFMGQKNIQPNLNNNNNNNYIDNDKKTEMRTKYQHYNNYHNKNYQNPNNNFNQMNKGNWKNNGFRSRPDTDRINIYGIPVTIAPRKEILQFLKNEFPRIKIINLEYSLRNDSCYKALMFLDANLVTEYFQSLKDTIVININGQMLKLSKDPLDRYLSFNVETSNKKITFKKVDKNANSSSEASYQDDFLSNDGLD
jgi:hypothetical protein